MNGSQSENICIYLLKLMCTLGTLIIEGIGGLVKLQFLKSYCFQSIKTQSMICLPNSAPPPPPPISLTTTPQFRLVNLNKYPTYFCNKHLNIIYYNTTCTHLLNERRFNIPFMSTIACSPRRCLFFNRQNYYFMVLFLFPPYQNLFIFYRFSF